MKLQRISTLVWRDYLIFLRSRWRWLEFFYFPITSLLIWGLFALWTQEFASLAGRVALTVNIFWSFAYIVQSTINLSINEDAWHAETHHLFITGIGKWEYLFARIVFGILISLLNLAFMLVVTHFLFFNLSGLLLPTALFCFLSAFLSVSLAMCIAGLIFFLGRDFHWLAWAALQFFILLSFPLSPLEILPETFQAVARIMPFGELFEGVRNVLLGVSWADNAVAAGFAAVAYFFLGIFIYKFGFDYSRRSGKFAKMF